MKLGFIGAGNMATGIARGLAPAEGRARGAGGDAVRRRRRRSARRQLAEEVGGEALESNREVADAADLVLLAVKPNVLDEVAPDLVEAGTPVISILAGTSLERLAEALPGHRPGPRDAQPGRPAAPGGPLRRLPGRGSARRRGSGRAGCWD